MWRSGQYVEVFQLYPVRDMLTPTKYSKARRKGVKGRLLRAALWESQAVWYVQHLDNPKIVAAYFTAELREIPNPYYTSNLANAAATRHLHDDVK